MSHTEALHASGDKFADPGVPASLDFDWYPITFKKGVAAGGSAHVTIRQDGSYTWRGHFHDSGAGAYNTAIAWLIKDSENHAYTFQHKGHISGTFQAGSRNDDWSINGVSDVIRSRWSIIAAGWNWQASARVNFDVGALLQGLLSPLGSNVQATNIVPA